MVDEPRPTGLDLSEWRQFGEVELRFHPQLTVITGANASGKTTLLTLLARHFNWQRTYVGVPETAKSRGGAVWHWLSRRRREASPTQPSEVGRLHYSDGQSASIQLPPEQGQQSYDLNIVGLRTLPGVFLPSHRSMTAGYVGIGTIPISFQGFESILEQFSTEVRTRAAGNAWQKHPVAWLKEALISAAVFGEGNSSVEPNPQARELWDGYQEVLRQLLPTSLGFRRLVVRASEIVVETDSGPFVMDESSGGMYALMEVSWQIFLRSRNQDSFTVLWDEPENHLHPSLQRDVLPNLIRAFPRLQFIVASHSPFLVTAVADSAVYVLDYDERHRVNSRLLDHVNKAASAEETLHAVLGLDSTMPRWAETRFREIVSSFLADAPTPQTLANLRAALERAGLEREFPTAVVESAAQARGEQER